MSRLTPRQLVERFPYSALRVRLTDLKTLQEKLIVEFNERAVTHYVETGEWLDSGVFALEIPGRVLAGADGTSVEIGVQEAGSSRPALDQVMGVVGKLLKGLEAAPDNLIDFVPEPSPPPPVAKTPSTRNDGTEWVDNIDSVRKFTEFVQSRYVVSNRPETKFADLLRVFTVHSGVATGNKWSARYASICATLNLRVEKVPTEQFQSGVYHVYLRLRS